MMNREIAERLREMSIYYEMDEVPFKPAAYEKAADSIASLGEEVSSIFEKDGKDGLKTISGVGEGIAHDIEEILKRGVFPELAKARKKLPADVLGLTAVENVGPKTVKVLYKKLKIKKVADLEKAARTGKISTLPHFGKKTEKNILKNIGFLEQDSKRSILGHILPVATRLENRLRALRDVKHAVVAGSIRRKKETVGDMDIVVTSDRPNRVLASISEFDEVKEILEHGRTMVVLRLKNGIHVDIRIVPDRSFGAALQHFTGSKDHNVTLRKLAASKGLKLNEYGLWRGKRRLASRTEREVYAKIGLPYIEPEMRTDTGEIDAALTGVMPKLVPYGSVRGDLQVQTDWTDGDASIETMAEHAMALGLEYMAVTDHTKGLAMTGGLDGRKILAQGREIDQVNLALRKRRRGFRILKGSEVNILKNGKPDIGDSTLAKLDIVGVGVHSHFKLKEGEQTKRIIAAMNNPHVDIIFHPTGRIIQRRPAYEVDMEALLKAAKRTGTAMEIDAYPDRSDLRDTHVRMAVELGVKLVINTDAHAPDHLRYLDLGVAIARRGWAEKTDVLNTKKFDELKKWFAKPKEERR